MVYSPPAFLEKAGDFYFMGMKSQFRILETSVFISLGIHLLLIMMVSFLFRDLRIRPFPPLSIEVSLLPPILSSITEEKPSLKPQAKTEERMEAQEAKKEDPIVSPGASPEPPLPVEAEVIQTEVKPIPVIHSQPPLLQREEERTRTTLSLEMGSTSQGPTKDEKILIARIHPNSEVSPGVRLPIASSNSSSSYSSSSSAPAESSVSLVKSPPSSEEKIISARPKYGENPKPVYPAEARKEGYQGEVVLRVEVLTNGRVGQIEMKTSSGHEVLDRSALAAVKQWKFIPAKEGKNVIPVWVNVPIKFQLQ